MNYPLAVLLVTCLSPSFVAAASYDSYHLSPVQLGVISGMTYGGEEIGEKVTVSGNNLTSDLAVRSGNLYFWMARAAVNINRKTGVMIDMGQHWHIYDEDDGKVSFNRYRVAILPFYRDHYSLRWALGPSLDFGAEYQADLSSGESINENFDPAFGIVGDISFDPLESFYVFGIKAQWVNYHGDNSTNVSGSHIGAYIGIELDY